jgi:hypothetical protein
LSKDSQSAACVCAEPHSALPQRPGAQVPLPLRPLPLAADCPALASNQPEAAAEATRNPLTAPAKRRVARWPEVVPEKDQAGLLLLVTLLAAVLERDQAGLLVTLLVVPEVIPVVLPPVVVPERGRVAFQPGALLADPGRGRAGLLAGLLVARWAVLSVGELALPVVHAWQGHRVRVQPTACPHCYLAAKTLAGLLASWPGELREAPHKYHKNWHRR